MERLSETSTTLLNIPEESFDPRWSLMSHATDILLKKHTINRSTRNADSQKTRGTSQLQLQDKDPSREMNEFQLRTNNPLWNLLNQAKMRRKVTFPTEGTDLSKSATATDHRASFINLLKKMTASATISETTTSSSKDVTEKKHAQRYSCLNLLGCKRWRVTSV
uniref:Uncharacterized protein n=1 Tax=Plectus sambesii TaxID=2011161 RepID=A0A914WYC0_9BILA